MHTLSVYKTPQGSWSYSQPTTPCVEHIIEIDETTEWLIARENYTAEQLADQALNDLQPEIRIIATIV